MSALELILFIIGVGLIIAVIVWAVKRSKRLESELIERLEPELSMDASQDSSDESEQWLNSEAIDAAVSNSEVERQEPTLNDPMNSSQSDISASLDDELDPSEAWDQAMQASFNKRMEPAAPESLDNPLPSPMDQNVVVLYLIAPRACSFPGLSVKTQLERHGLVHGEQEIFHSLSADGQSLYSVASATKPGHFDIARMEFLDYQGLVFMMDIEAMEQPKLIFKDMLAMIHEVSLEIGGVICDEHRQRLNQVSVAEYLTRIKAAVAKRSAIDV